MRLRSLTLENYGIFRAQRIAFDPTPGRINLLIAPNGAGKSILRNAFCDLLFGIHGQTPMGFRYGYGRMRLQAEAEAPGGSPFVFGRRKGQGNTLIDADGTTLDPVELASVLGPADRALVERLFALDTEHLRRGGEELLASNGSVADALLSAAGGLRHARQMQQSLQAARDSLAPLRRSQGRPFYQSLDRMTAARQLMSSAALKPELREKQETELRHLRAQQEECNKRAQAASQKITRLERIRRVAGVLAEHDAAASWLASHPDAPDLPEGIGERLTKAREELSRAEQRLQDEQQHRAAPAEELQGVAFDAALIAQGEAIERLVDRAGVARQALEDIPKRDAEHAAATEHVSALLRQLGSPLPPDRAAECVPARAAVVQARRIAAEHEKLRTLLALLPTELAQAERELAETEHAFAQIPAAVDMRALIRLVREIRAAGDPDQRLHEAGQTLADRRAKLDFTLARARGWARGADALIALPVLPAETYERLQAEFVEAEANLTNAARHLADLRAEHQRDKARLDNIAAGQTMPDDDAIKAARERRDVGWRLIYRRAFTAEAPDAAREGDWAGDVPLPLAYERSVSSADELADRRNREGERLVQAAELTRRIDEQTASMAAAEAACAAALARRDDARAGWQDACGALGMSKDATLSELRALLNARDRAIDAHSDVAAGLRAQHELQQLHSAWAARVAAETGADAALGLSDLLALADEHIEANRRAEEDRNRLQERLAAHRRTRDEKAFRLREAETELAAVMQNWALVRQALQRPDMEDPATTLAMLDMLSELDKEQQHSTGLRHRLREMRDEVAAFGAAAIELGAGLAPDLASGDAFVVVQTLRQRLTEHRALERQHKTLAETLKRADAGVARQQKHLEGCRVELRTVLALIGRDSIEEAQARVALAAQRAQMLATVQRGESELLAKGDGHSIAALRAEFASVVTDDVPGAIDVARAEHDAENTAAQALAARVATAQADMERQALEDTATRAAADQQAAVASLQRIMDEATVMHLAAALLDAALTQVEMAGTSVLLSRIAALFCTITGGAYARLEVEENPDGSARLIAVHRDFGDERKSVADLSEGERDQLFLALRLAAIEDHVATMPPLPFVGDDILQTFDDDRAAAAMQALVQLSESVQVILLSHHQHLAALSQRLPADRLHLCELQTEPTA